ncbi:Uncharacterized membrane protein YckC, RDD family [Halobacillus alkaliphilus]|uniref:Uncharacterized membrane protein YckC, RDD family n=1 Tax=Halobacillus alkaliphilus TaxID=396056 RepID=A0A1I2JKV7_9BACI|nr:RDD family protein [Halobacillus alkaliphilus]SFF55535.1 Uncharacterized membrane protein YckC, RDD family [Halobacillus alkaliphilus]
METTEEHPGVKPPLSLMRGQKEDIQRLLYAGFWTRFFAYIIDLLVLWSVNTVVTKPLIGLLNLEEAELWIEMFSASNLLTSLLFFLYFILMTKFFRATLGKMIFGLSVESLTDKPLTNGQIFFRECIGRYISMAIFGIPYLVVAFTKRHQGIHDLFADTSVIKNKFRQLNHLIEDKSDSE